VGGNGGNGGTGGISGTTGFRGGNGGGSGCGEAVIAGSSQMASCTVAFNTAISGSGGQGGAGTFGSAKGSDGTVCPGSYGGLTGGNLLNTLLATNGPGGNVHYTINDLGHNLSSDSSGNLTNASLNNTNPKLSPLARNGGPNLTIALLAGSPAIDAANTTAAPATDQRGFPRPSGHAADIGAFEYGSTLPALAISQSGKTGMVLRALGDAGQSCRLFRSTDLSNWVSFITNPISADGTMVYFDAFVPGIQRRFYRSTIP